jgi:hypothetical protein
MRALMTFEVVGLVLCLLASTVSACACIHHIETVPVESVSSCHEHGRKANEPGASHEPAEPAENGPAVTDCACACFERTPQLYSKSNSFKVTEAGQVDNVATISLARVVSVLVVPNVFLHRPAYLSDPFYNLSPGRAPPAI